MADRNYTLKTVLCGGARLLFECCSLMGLRIRSIILVIIIIEKYYVQLPQIEKSVFQKALRAVWAVFKSACVKMG